MELTTRKFWSDYWYSKIEEFEKPVASNYMFTPLFRNLIEGKNFKNACELGGFPGTFSIHVQRDLSLPCCLIDYFIDSTLFEKFLQANQLPSNAIEWKEEDILSTPTAEKTFDFIFSIGLIEHFEDTKTVISAHIKYINEGGRLFILIPNFTGINGWFQRKFDIENYKKHYIPCMDPNYLKSILKELGCKNIQGGYWGNFTIWLENYSSQNLLSKLFFKASWVMGKVISKIIPVNAKTTSPYIWVAADM